MWTSRVTSGKEQKPADVIRVVLNELIDENSEGAWAHFEVVDQRGWFRNLLWGNKPWIEVALDDTATLALNIAFFCQKKIPTPPIPENWKLNKEGDRKVPISDLEDLIEWINHCLASASGYPNFKTSGWLDGL